MTLSAIRAWCIADPRRDVVSHFPRTRNVAYPPLTHCAAHQIRVHLQYLGYPIANDPLYGLKSVWGPLLGRGGVELVKNSTSQAEYQASVLAARQVPASSSSSSAQTKFRPLPNDADRMNGVEAPPDEESLQIKAAKTVDLDDRKVDNIDVTSPILLSQQAKEVIARLRRMKDEQEDWVKSVLCCCNVLYRCWMG